MNKINSINQKFKLGFWINSILSTLLALFFVVFDLLVLPELIEVYSSFGIYLHRATLFLIEYSHFLLIPIIISIYIWMNWIKYRLDSLKFAKIRKSFFILNIFYLILLILIIFATYISIFKLCGHYLI